MAVRDGQGTERDSPANFCPGPDCPVALSLGPGPDSGDLQDRDRDHNIVQGQALIPCQNIIMWRNLDYI